MKRLSIMLLIVLAIALAVPAFADSYDRALLHLNGDDGSLIITDATGRHTWVSYNNAQIDTAQSVFGGASLLMMEENSQAIYAADHADWQLDDGSNTNLWTADFWTRFDGDPGTGAAGFLHQQEDPWNLWRLYLLNNALTFQVRDSSTDTVLISQAWNPAGDTWYHVAVVKNGATGYLFFVNGTQLGSTVQDTSPIPDFYIYPDAANLIVGWYADLVAETTIYFDGWIDELRISKGVARWTADFTPPNMQYGDAELTQTAAAITATQAYYQTQTAAALTATFEANQTATAAANQTATAAALTATHYANQTATAAALTATRQAEILATAQMSMPTHYITTDIALGDAMDFTLLLCAGLVVVIGFAAFLARAFLVRGTS